MKVALLRPEEYIEETLNLLHDSNFEIIVAPFLNIRINEEGMKRLKNSDFDVAIVTSQTAAKIVSGYADIFKNKKVIAIGKKTAKVLSEAGIKAEIPEKFDSQTIYEEYKDRLKGLHVLLLRSDRGDPILLKLGEVAEVDEIVLYRIEKEWGEKQRELLLLIAEEKVDVVIFSSSMMVKSFMELAEEMRITDRILDALRRIHIIAIGPPTAKMLRNYGLKAMIPSEYTFNGIAKLLLNLRIKEV
jgi:uroporphyrinogen-III synthase